MISNFKNQKKIRVVKTRVFWGVSTQKKKMGLYHKSEKKLRWQPEKISGTPLKITFKDAD